MDIEDVKVRMYRPGSAHV